MRGSNLGPLRRCSGGSGPVLSSTLITGASDGAMTGSERHDSCLDQGNYISEDWEQHNAGVGQRWEARN